MKIADRLEVNASQMNFAALASGENCVEVNIHGKPVLQLGRIGVAGFSGALALPDKLRCHRTNDNLCAEFDSVNTIPFGCEYKVKRHWVVFNNIALLNCDIAADNGGTIRDLELEPVKISLKPAKIEFRICGEQNLHSVENPSGEIYCGNAAVLMLRVTSLEGVQAEYVCGDDLWRHMAAEKIEGASANYTITASENGVILTRKVLITPEEVIMEKRPWKFKSIFSWRDPKCEPVRCPDDPETIDKFTIPGCFASAYAHRGLRKIVRASGARRQLVMQGGFPVICDDPAHLERPAKHPVMHSDLASAAADYLWANRELAKRDSILVMESSSTFYGESVVLANLGNSITTFEEE